jgi:3-methyladenine DNA glycosylase Tag
LNLVCVVFYSGFRAATVTAKLPSIRRYFSDYNAVAEYGEDEIDRILHVTAPRDDKKRAKGPRLRKECSGL